MMRINFADHKKPNLLVYGITWREPRNVIFMHYLSSYFNILVVTAGPVKNELLELVKPAIIRPLKFIFNDKIGFAVTPYIRNILKEFQPQFIFSIETHSFAAYHSIRMAAKLRAMSVIFTWQNVKTIPKLWIQKFIQKAILKKSDFLIAGSIHSKYYLLNKGAEEKKIYIIPETGYDRRIFLIKGDNLRNIWDYGSSDFVVLYSGRLVKEKGIEVILRVAKRIEHKLKNIKFAFVGTGPLKEKVETSDLTNVRYHGPYDFTDMGKVMRTCDLLIYPSISTKYWVEQFGYAPIEAVACGKPVVVSNSGALQFFINNEKNGTMISEDSFESLENAIILWFERWKSRLISVDTKNIDKYSAENIAKAYAEILLLSEKTKYKKNW